MADAILDGSHRVFQLVNFRGERLKAIRAIISRRFKRPYLRDILQPVATIDQNTMGVQHVGDGDGRINHA